MALCDALRAELTAAVGTTHVLVDDDLRAPHEVDWTGRFHGRSAAVVRPASTPEVAAVVRACASAGHPVVVQGGNTGLVGGGVPAHGEVVVATTRLDAVDAVDAATRTVAVGAGATLAAVQRHAAAAGLRVGVDLAARDSATIGGLVSTDAGGVHVVAHGSMRAQVAGLEAVLADGTVLSSWMGGLGKDTAGYALPQLLVGAEGTLGVVTRVRVRLHPPTGASVVAVVGVTDAAAAVGVLEPLRAAAGPTLAACELVLRAGMELVCAVTGMRDPVPGAGAALVIELRADGGDAEPPTDRLRAVAAHTGVVGVAVGVDEPDRRRLWSLRERHTEAVATLGVPHKLDVAVPMDRLPDLLARVDGVVARAAPGAVVHTWGHAAEGNLHVNVVGPPADDEAVDVAVLTLVGELGGTVSAEHGIGRAKVRHLHLTRDPASIATMRAIKRALDPGGLLGPGVVLPPA